MTSDQMYDLVEELKKTIEDTLQEMTLAKGGFPCVRCGKGGQSSKGARCSGCMNKLTRQRKTPGHYQRAQRKADSALRRQDGENGTASKKSSGRGDRKTIVAQHQRAEKKTGQKLSPDRKDNSKGYSGKNTRAVPENLNRGRHTVDSKKLSAWRKKLKKSGIEFDDFKTFLLLKINENQPLLSDKIETLTEEQIDAIME